MDFVPRNFPQTPPFRSLEPHLSGVIRANVRSQKLFANIPRNFSKCSQEHLPEIVRTTPINELWWRKRGQGLSKGMAAVRISGLRY